MTGTQDIGQRRQAGDHRRVRGDTDREKRAIGQRDPHELALAAIRRHALAVRRTPPAAVHAGGGHPIAAVHAGAVAHVERCDHEITRLHDPDPAADLLDHPDELVPHLPRRGNRGDTPEGPQVGPAHAGRDHSHDRVVTGRQLRIRQRFQPHVPSPVHHRCTHTWRPTFSLSRFSVDAIPLGELARRIRCRATGRKHPKPGPDEPGPPFPRATRSGRRVFANRALQRGQRAPSKLVLAHFSASPPRGPAWPARRAATDGRRRLLQTREPGSWYGVRHGQVKDLQLPDDCARIRGRQGPRGSSTFLPQS